MGAGEIFKVSDQGGDARRHIKSLQHMATNKIGQIAYRFEGYGLVKQFQGLVIVNAKTPAKPGAVGGKTIKQINATSAQLFAQPADLTAETGKIGTDGEIAFTGSIQARRLGIRVFGPEHLRQGHGFVVTGIVKNTKNDRITIGVTQGH